jgi:triosephosphate isomerase
VDPRDVLVLVHVKTYEETTGDRAVKLAKAMGRVAKETGVPLALAPQLVDLRLVARANEVPVYAQHVDAVGAGPFTGWVAARAVKEAGAVGTILNHSERRLDADLPKHSGEPAGSPSPRRDPLAAAVEAAREAGLIVIACSKDANDSVVVSRTKPHYVAVEPPELIGGDVSVTSADPGVVRTTVERVRKVSPSIKVLCGAGVKNGMDVRAALDLGASGVLLASGVAKAKDWDAALRDLCNGAIGAADGSAAPRRAGGRASSALGKR